MVQTPTMRRQRGRRAVPLWRQHRGRRVPRWVAVVMAGGLAAIGLLPAGAPVMASAATTAGAATARAQVGPAAPVRLRVGRLTLSRCARKPLTYCGTIAVPLDYSSAVSPDIHIGFRWLPATKVRHGKHTVLAVEGGPGFATTGTEPEYRAMLGTLIHTHNLLLVNLRGTGNSTLLDCPGLENFGRVQHQYGAAFNRAVAACGWQLNHTWHYRDGGGWVHASDLFNTAYSARDVSRVVRDLEVGRVDLYGDSYGSWFAQVFASRYPGLLRSVTLDSTYQVLDLKPWYTTTVVTARRAFDQACTRSLACRAATRGQGTAWHRVAELDARLEREPVSGETVSESGNRTRITVTAETLVNLVNNAGFDPTVYQDLDAAGRALLEHNDKAPLLRLAALSVGFDDTNYPLPEFSDGLYFAVGCTDYVQLFSRRATPAVRARQYREAKAEEPQHVFAPFTITQWTDMDEYTEAYSACLDWPTPTRLVRPITRKPPLVPRRLHVLILSGTFDSLTPWLDGATLVARQFGPTARVVRVANLTHVNLQDVNDSCPASIYQRFLLHPADLARENTSCARRVAPIHTVGTYPRLLSQAVPATPTSGNTAGREALQAASVALASVGDEISRWPELADDHDRGLRGGVITFSGSDVLRIRFRSVRWVSNATINGTARWNLSTNRVHARLTVRPPGAPPVRLTAVWLAFAQQSQLAVITGSQGSLHLAAVCLAP
jgi:pimeloyl-ACP methyl ester carboxylesterase